MGVDEWLFGWAHRKWRERRTPPVAANVVALSQVIDELRVLAAAVARARIEIHPAADAIGETEGHTLRLPPSLAVAATADLNRQAYRLRTACNALYVRAMLDDTVPPTYATDGGLWLWRRLLDEFPGAATELTWVAQSPRIPGASAGDADVLLGRLLPPPKLWRIDGTATGLPSRSATEKSAKRPAGKVRRLVLSADPNDENPVVHSFEKLHTADSYQGGKKRVDSSDELEDHQEALGEIDAQDVVRSSEAAKSIFRVDADFAGLPSTESSPETAEPAAVAYDEWDERAAGYRRGWCQLIEERPSVRIDAVVDAQVRQQLARQRREREALRGTLIRELFARRWQARQLDGPEVDLDAMVDRYACLASGHVSPDRLYLFNRRAPAKLSLLLLVDTSLSADAWVANRRVLDVCKESLLLIGGALEDLPIELAIGGFHSNTHADCRYLALKRFEDPWSDAVRRISAIEPAGYTRIGPAIRHAKTVMRKSPSRHQLVILLSDGKPTDYDRYEGRYGIADVRQAVRELAQEHVRFLALAIDHQHRPHFREMFGLGNFRVLPRPEMLRSSLAQACAAALR